MRSYVRHAGRRTFREWMEGMAPAINPAIRLRFGEYNDHLDLDYSLLDLNALHNETGYLPEADFEESIQEMAECLLKEEKKMNNKSEKVEKTPEGEHNVILAAFLPAYAARVREVWQ